MALRWGRRQSSGVGEFSQLSQRRVAGADSIGVAYRHLGRHAEAIAAYQPTLALLRDIGHRYHAAETLVHLGDTYRASGDT